MVTVAAIVLAGGFWPNAEDPPLVLPPMPPLTDQAWRLSEVGTSEIGLQLSYGTPEVDVISYQYCYNACRGGVHLLHEQCDASCDRACEAVHQRRSGAGVVPEHTSFFTGRGARDIGAGLNQFGHAAVEDALRESISTKIETDFGKDKLNDLGWEWKERHWNQEPCTHVGKALRTVAVPVVAKWSLRRYDTAPDGRQVLVQGPSGECVVAHVRLPDRQSVPDKSTVVCRCTILGEEERKVGFVPGVGIELRGGIGQTGVCLGESKEAPQATVGYLQECGFQIECEDMTTATVSATNTTGQEFTLVIHPGTVFESQDAKVQDMGVVERIVLPVPPGLRASVSVPLVGGSAEWFPRAEASGRVLCLNMNRREPSPGDKFKVGLPASTDVLQVAAYTAGLRVRTQTDQARMWIVTDRASRTEIEKVMIPGPSEAGYVRAMFEAHHLTSLDLTTDEFKRLWEPGLAAGAAGGEEEFAWFVAHMAESDPKGLASGVRASIGHYAAMLGPEARSYERETPAVAARVLGGAPSTEVAAACAELVLRGVPEAARVEFSAAGGLDGLGLWLTRDDPAGAETALEVMETFRTPETKFWLLNASPRLPEALRARCAALLGG